MMTPVWLTEKPLHHIFLWPLLIAVACLSGLVADLLVDDAREWLAELAVALPVLVSVLGYGLQWIRRRR